MRITITIDTDTNDVKVDVPVKPEVPPETKPDVPLPNDYHTRKYDPLPANYYTPNSTKPFIIARFTDPDLDD